VTAVVILPRAEAQIVEVLDYTRETFGEASDRASGGEPVGQRRGRIAAASSADGRALRTWRLRMRARRAIATA
jgi:hypothetical protein